MYPFSKEINEVHLNNFRKEWISKVWESLWQTYILDLLDRDGYYINFEFHYPPTGRRYNLGDYYEDIKAIGNKIIEYLLKFEKNPEMIFIIFFQKDFKPIDSF